MPVCVYTHLLSDVQLGTNVAELHKKICTCCKTLEVSIFLIMWLERMETILADFHRDLGNISSDIQDLQIRSMNMNQRLRNRQVITNDILLA